MTLKLNGSSSGYTAIDAPAAAGSNTLVLPTTNGSAGQVLQTDGSGNLSWVSVPSITESSWTAFPTGAYETTEITGISANAREITVVGVDISAADNSQKLRLRLGGAGGYKTSGYKITSCEGGGSNGGSGFTDGFTQEYVGGASYRMTFIWDLVNVNANIWTIKGMLNAWTGSGNAENTHFFITGRVDLGATLTKLQFDASNGSSFDDGDWKLYVTTLGA